MEVYHCYYYFERVIHCIRKPLLSIFWISPPFKEHFRVSPIPLQKMDRSHLVPRHQGPLVLPNSPFFGKLLRHARRGRLAICDVVAGVEKTYEDLLSDALTLRAATEYALSEDVKKELADGKEVFVGVLAAGGYEFAVAVVAALSLGAAVVPMCKHYRVQQLIEFTANSCSRFCCC